MVGAEYEEPEAMEVILRAKPSVDAVDAKKMTALHVAAGKCSLEIAKLLVGQEVFHGRRLSLVVPSDLNVAYVVCWRRWREGVRT